MDETEVPSVSIAQLLREMFYEVTPRAGEVPRSAARQARAAAVQAFVEKVAQDAGFSEEEIAEAWEDWSQSQAH